MGRGNVVGRASRAGAAACAAAAIGATIAGVAGALAAMPWQSVVRGSRIVDSEGVTTFVARSASDSRAQTRLFRPVDATRVAATDFRRFGVIGVSREFPACAWSVEVRGLVRSGATLTVRYVSRPPRKGIVACQARTLAYEVVRVPLAELRGVRVTRAIVGS
jgi:hypothetical protein